MWQLITPSAFAMTRMSATLPHGGGDNMQQSPSGGLSLPSSSSPPRCGQLFLSSSLLNLLPYYFTSYLYFARLNNNRDVLQIKTFLLIFVSVYNSTPSLHPSHPFIVLHTSLASFLLDGLFIIHYIIKCCISVMKHVSVFHVLTLAIGWSKIKIQKVINWSMLSDKRVADRIHGGIE